MCAMAYAGERCPNKRARPVFVAPTAPSVPRLARRRSPLTDDATGRPTANEETLARALAAAHDTLAAKIALIEAGQAAGTMAPELTAQQAAAAQAVYDRDCALARIQADTGWHTWAGVHGV